MHLFLSLLFTVAVVAVLNSSIVLAVSGPPSNYTIGCMATVSTYGGPPFDFRNPLPYSTYCPPTQTTPCEPDYRVSAFLYQVDQINAAKQILPDTTLITACVDDQADSSRAFFAAIDLLDFGVHSVFGTYYSRVALNAALVLKGENVPLIGWASTDPELSNKKLYSNYGRVCQSDAGQAVAMAFLAATQFNWETVALIYTADAYGQGGADVFVQTYLNYNLSIISDQSVIANASPSDVELPLQRIKSIGIQTIVFFGHPEEFESIIARGSQPDLNLFNNRTAWLVSDADLLGSGPEWKKAAAAGLLNGIMGFALNDGRSLQPWQDWATGYMNRNTTGMNPMITYKPQSFQDISAYDVLAADSANVAAVALKTLFDAGNYNPTPTDWYYAIHGVHTQGITGNISFDANFDRAGIMYSLLNMKSGAWTPVATYIDGTLELTRTAPFLFSDGTPFPPTSFPLPAPPPPPATSVIAPVTNHVLLAVTVFVLILTAVFAACLIMGREVKVFQNASVAMLAIMLIGAVLVCISVLVALQTQSPSTCTASQFLFNLGFMLTIGAILLKTYRVHIIFNSYKLQVTVMTDNRLIIATVAMLFFDSIVLILRDTVAPYQLNESLVCSFQDGYQTTAATTLSLILVCTKALMLLYTAYLTFRVRNLPSRFNESSYLSVCVYNAALLCLIWIVIRYAVSTDPHPDTINVFECVLKLIGTTLILTLIFLPKCITALGPIISRRASRSNSGGKNSGEASTKAAVSILALSGTEGGGNQKTRSRKEGHSSTHHTKSQLEAIIDATILSQTEILERSYAHLDALHAAIAERKAVIQTTIDLLNQLDAESKFFRECVAKSYSDNQIVHIFESRLKDIMIPQQQQQQQQQQEPVQQAPGMPPMQSIAGKQSSMLSMSPLRHSMTLPRSVNNNTSLRFGSPASTRATLASRPLPKHTLNFQSPSSVVRMLKDSATGEELTRPTFHPPPIDPTTPTKSIRAISNSTMPRAGLGFIGRQDSVSSNAAILEGYPLPLQHVDEPHPHHFEIAVPPIVERSPSTSNLNAAPTTPGANTPAPTTPAPTTPAGTTATASPRRARVRIHLTDDASTFSVAFHGSGTPSPAVCCVAPSTITNTPATTIITGDSSPRQSDSPHPRSSESSHPRPSESPQANILPI